MKQTENTNVILFATHQLNPFILKQYHRLKEGVIGIGDLYLLLHDEKNDIYVPQEIKSFIFNQASLRELHYTPISDSVMENNHFPLLKFYRDFPNYDYYWNIEYDVLFTGAWNYLFQAYAECEADLVTSHLERFRQRPAWHWWKTLCFKTFDIPVSMKLKSFNPIYRISNRALALLNKVLLEGNIGYQEAFIPSVLNYFGMKIIDFNNRGEFASEDIQESFYLSNYPLNDNYSDSSMRYRPLFYPDNICYEKVLNTLFHPVKF